MLLDYGWIESLLTSRVFSELSGDTQNIQMRNKIKKTSLSPGRGNVMLACVQHTTMLESM